MRGAAEKPQEPRNDGTGIMDEVVGIPRQEVGTCETGPEPAATPEILVLGDARGSLPFTARSPRWHVAREDGAAGGPGGPGPKGWSER